MIHGKESIGLSFPLLSQHPGAAMNEQNRPIEDVLASYAEVLMRTPGVVGTGIGLCDDSPCIKVFLENGRAETLENIPLMIEGYRVDPVVTGEVRAL